MHELVTRNHFFSFFDSFIRNSHSNSFTTNYAWLYSILRLKFVLCWGASGSSRSQFWRERNTKKRQRNSLAMACTKYPIYGRRAFDYFVFSFFFFISFQFISALNATIYRSHILKTNWYLATDGRRWCVVKSRCSVMPPPKKPSANWWCNKNVRNILTRSYW